VVQVDAINPALKAPETKRLKLKYDDPLSNFGFKFNLRRYLMATIQLITSLGPLAWTRFIVYTAVCAAGLGLNPKS
jgi:hypothetical protein